MFHDLREAVHISRNAYMYVLLFKPSSHMPQTCLRRACDVSATRSPLLPAISSGLCERRHAADIAGCPGPCRGLTGKVELSSTLPVCQRCFRPLLDDRR